MSLVRVEQLSKTYSLDRQQVTALKNINLSDLKSETPWLSSVPFASFFLGRRGSVKEMENLMVIVKATITDLKEEENRFRR